MPPRPRRSLNKKEVFLVTKDGVKVKELFETVRCSSYIQSRVEGCPMRELHPTVELVDVTSEQLRLVLSWVRHRPHVDNGVRYFKDVPMRQIDKQFFRKLTNSQLFDVVLGSHYLKIDLLYDMSCMVASKMIQNKKPEEINALFSNNNLTREEEMRIRMDIMSIM